MTSEQIAFGAVESDALAADLDAAFDLASFERIARGSSAFGVAVQSCRPEGLKRRIFALARDRGERGAEHPHDAAIAVYLLALEGLDRAGCRAAARYALGRVGLGWWAPRVAGRIVESLGAQVSR